MSKKALTIILFISFLPLSCGDGFSSFYVEKASSGTKTGDETSDGLDTNDPTGPTDPTDPSNPDSGYVTDISISPSITLMEAGDVQNLSATVLPVDAPETGVVWSSGNTSVLTVTNSGVVTAVGGGRAAITAVTIDGGFTDSVEIRVLPHASFGTITNPVAGDKETYYVDEFEFSVTYLPDNTSGVVLPTGISDSTTATISKDFWMADTEVTYELWYEVRVWASTEASVLYTFQNVGLEGDESYAGTPNEHKYKPVTNITIRDAMVWTNALTEWFNFHNGTSYDCVFLHAHATTPIRNSNVATPDVDSPYINTSAKGFRLPTSDEWSISARYIGQSVPLTGNDLDSEYITQNYNGGSPTLSIGFYWTPGDYASGAVADYTHGTDTSAVSWYNINSGLAIHEVAALTPNSLGIYDMCGNVSEWVWGNTATNRPYRGGHYNSSATDMRLGQIYTATADYSATTISFRFCKDH
jgi:formylglycine-generating enzyme required for sulfatase activity